MWISHICLTDLFNKVSISPTDTNPVHFFNSYTWPCFSWFTLKESVDPRRWSCWLKAAFRQRKRRWNLMCTDLTLPHLDVSSPSADKSADLCVYVFVVMHIRVCACCRPAHSTRSCREAWSPWLKSAGTLPVTILFSLTPFSLLSLLPSLRSAAHWLHRNECV